MNPGDYSLIAFLIFLAQANAKDQKFLNRMVVIYFILSVAFLVRNIIPSPAVHYPLAVF
jgi:hypothetical protein